MLILLTVLQAIAAAVFGGAMIYAAISDLRRFEVPNWVSGVIVASFLVIAAGGPGPWSAILGNIITGLAVLSVGFALFAAGWLGAGDVKLLSAIALWTGWPLLLPYLTLVVLVGGVLTAILIVFRRFPLNARFAAIRWIEQQHARKKDVPYAVPIAMTALFLLPRMPIAADLFVR